MRRSNFMLLMLFFAILPFLCLLLGIQCWLLWQETTAARASMEKLEADYQMAESRAEKLENLDMLLREENVRDRDMILRQIGASHESAPIADAVEKENGEAPDMSEGPGHEDFPAVDTGRVKVSNVQVRALRDNSLRIGLDLRNPDNEPLLSGEVEATLLTAAGEKMQLRYSQPDVGNFRISRFKRTVMIAPVPRAISLDNAQIIVEVKEQGGKTLYRNIFAVQQ